MEGGGEGKKVLGMMFFKNFFEGRGGISVVIWTDLHCFEEIFTCVCPSFSIQEY